MSYEERINHLKDEFSKNSHKLRMADATDLREWVESLEVAKRKADEYEAKAKAFDEISFVFVDSLANNYDDHSIVQNIAKVIENEKGDYYV